LVGCASFLPRDGVGRLVTALASRPRTQKEVKKEVKTL
jgi:hypothetical protein